MSKNGGIIVDTLFVGPTRPTMFLGVTWQAFVVNIIVTMEAFVWTRNLLWLLLFIPFHGICYLMCLRDPRIFELLMKWGPSKGFAYASTFFFWRSATYSPLELDTPKNRSFSRRRKARKVQ